MSDSCLRHEIVLPCGIVLKNRVVKAAMTEMLADSYNMATEDHVTLYREWAGSNCAVLITGNICIDRRYAEHPGNVCIDGPQTPLQMERLQAFARAGKDRGNHVWAQLSHGGRQSSVSISPMALAPSSVDSCTSKPTPMAREMTRSEIDDVVDRFAHAAQVCQDAGFTGVQIHAAHGYLLSQFLSPLSNRRTDEFGGCLENRTRLLLRVVRHVRERVGDSFPVSVKLNSSDFQTGGFSHDDAVQVAKALDEAQVDVLEVSGGTYEVPAMAGTGTDGDVSERTMLREAYFLKYAHDIAESLTASKIMITGGFRSKNAMEAAIDKGAMDLIGVARPLCVDSRCTAMLLAGTASTLPAPERIIPTPALFRWLASSKVKRFAALAVGTSHMGCVARLQSIAKGGVHRIEVPPTALQATGTILRLQWQEVVAGYQLRDLPPLPAAHLAELRALRRRRIVTILVVLILISVAAAGLARLSR